MFKLPISMAETAELVERTVTIRTAMKIEIDQILFIKTSVDSLVLGEQSYARIVSKARATTPLSGKRSAELLI